MACVGYNEFHIWTCQCGVVATVLDKESRHFGSSPWSPCGFETVTFSDLDLLHWIIVRITWGEEEPKKHPVPRTVMAKNIGTLSILSENAILLSENCYSCKYFGTHMFISLVCIGTTHTHTHTHKNREEKSNLIQSHTETQKCTDQHYWHPV